MSERSGFDPTRSAGYTDTYTAVGIVKPHFEVNTATGRNSLLLPLEGTNVVDAGLLEKLAAQGFKPKTEFHVTAFDDKPGSEVATLVHGLDETRQAGIFDLLRGAAEHGRWQISPRGEFYLVEKQYAGEETPRRSVIQMVDCSQLSAFYEALNEILPEGSEIEAPPAHITLATQGSPRGIGISKLADIQSLGRRVDIA